MADHRRNSHNYMKDAWGEWACIQSLETILPWLTTEAKLSGKNYPDVYDSLSHALEEQVEKFSGSFWNENVKKYFHQMAEQMRIWAKVTRQLGS